MERETIPAAPWEKDWVETEEAHLGREPRLKTVGIITCKGPLETNVAGNSSDGEKTKAQLDLVLIHNEKWHQRSEPCHKRFYTR